MKKLVIGAAALACASIAAANTVTSANIVGYAKTDVERGGLSLIAMNFSGSSNTVEGIVGDQLPANSVIYVWDKSEDKYVTCVNGRFGWNPNPNLELGDSMWLNAHSSGADASYSVNLNGEVLTTATNSVDLNGLVMTGFYFPVEVDFVNTDLAAQLPQNSVIYIWNTDEGKYDVHIKGRFGWTTATDVKIGPTTGFWVDPATPITWEEKRPFDM